MSAAGKDGATSCGESGSWTALRRPDGPTAAVDRTVQDPLEPLEGRWTLRILACLNSGEHRFADLRSAIPRVSANILTDRLRALERAGFVERRYLPLPHASHVYTLTEIATGLGPVLDALARWRTSQLEMSILPRRSGKGQSR